MRRTNLVLDDQLLEQATRVLGLKKIQSLLGFFGAGIWEGDLTSMREDRPRRGRLAKRS